MRISLRQVKRDYDNIICFYSEVEVEPNRVNCYFCSSCNHITKTRDIDKGVTPFVHSCESCDSTAKSSFYEDIATDKEPTQEWYRPTLKEFEKARKNLDLYEHLKNGGLVMRKIIKNEGI